MAIIELINPSPGTEQSAPYQAQILADFVKSIHNPVNIIEESGSSSTTYYGEIEIGTPTIAAFRLVGTGVLTAFTIWSTDDLAANVNDDNDWMDVTRMVMNGSASFSGTDIDDTFPVVTHLESKKLRVKCIVTGVAAHTVLAEALTIS